MLDKFAILGTVLALTLLAPGATSQGSWRIDSTSYVPVSHFPPNDRCTLGSAHAQAQSSGDSALGLGDAWEVTPLCDVTNVAVAEGLVNASLVFQPNRPEDKGRARVKAVVSAQGYADLRDDDCAAAALGWAEFKCTFYTIQAVLNKSAAETGSHQLGSVSAAYQGVGVSSSLVVGSGEGLFKDQSQDQNDHRECVDFLFMQFRSRAYIKVWANGGVWFTDPTADCACGMSTEGQIPNLVLDVCPGEEEEQEQNPNPKPGGVEQEEEPLRLNFRTQDTSTVGHRIK